MAQRWPQRLALRTCTLELPLLSHRIPPPASTPNSPIGGPQQNQVHEHPTSRYGHFQISDVQKAAGVGTCGPSLVHTAQVEIPNPHARVLHGSQESLSSHFSVCATITPVTTPPLCKLCAAFCTANTPNCRRNKGLE